MRATVATVATVAVAAVLVDQPFIVMHVVVVGICQVKIHLIMLIVARLVTVAVVSAVLAAMVAAVIEPQMVAAVAAALSVLVAMVVSHIIVLKHRPLVVHAAVAAVEDLTIALLIMLMALKAVLAMR